MLGERASSLLAREVGPNAPCRNFVGNYPHKYDCVGSSTSIFCGFDTPLFQREKWTAAISTSLELIAVFPICLDFAQNSPSEPTHLLKNRCNGLLTSAESQKNINHGHPAMCVSPCYLPMQVCGLVDLFGRQVLVNYTGQLRIQTFLRIARFRVGKE